MKYINRVYDENYLTTEGANVNEMEATVAEYMSMPGRAKKVVALCNGTSAIHLAVKLAAEKIYGSSTGISMPAGKGAGGSLYGEHVFVTDMTFDASVNPILYEGWRACLY